jgi:DNA-binding transcriptional regulator YiaG
MNARLHPMSGHRPFDQLRKRMPPERRARNAAATKEMLAEMALHELRQARERSQEELARALKVGQPAVAKLERRTDMYVSNLRRYIEALGGSLEITARFGDERVAITNFGDLEEPRAGSRKRSR